MLKFLAALFFVSRLLILFSDASWACSFSRKAIPTEAGESICSISRKLKDISPWTHEKLTALKRKRDEYGSKLLDWKLHFHGATDCGGNESILNEMWAALGKVSKEIRTLTARAIRAGALASKFAGRLDEFIMVFANAKGKHNYCLGSEGVRAKRGDLYDCFPTRKNFQMSEENLAKIPERVTERSGPDLNTVIEGINHSEMAAHLYKRYGEDAGANCNLIKGNSGILGGALHEKLWWGGGILTIGKGFEGKIKRENFGPGEIGNAKDSSSKAFWTASPSTIPHLKNTLSAFQAFKDSAEKITQKFAEIEKIEKQIEPCLSNETMEEKPTQSCFKNSVKLNAELQEANALLARYQKEKGPLPSEIALVYRVKTAHVWYLFLAILI